MKEKRIIRIGQGIDNIILDAPKTTVLQGLPEPAYIRNFLEEKKIVEDFGYSSESFLHFQIGFDEIYEFDNLNTYPIFKLFFKEEKLVYIIFTSYTEDVYYQDFILDNGIGFMDSMETIRQQMGEFDRTIAMKDYDGKFGYYTQGVEFIFAENQLRTIHFFKPFGR